MLGYLFHELDGTFRHYLSRAFQVRCQRRRLYHRIQFDQKCLDRWPSCDTIVLQKEKSVQRISAPFDKRPHHQVSKRPANICIDECGCDIATHFNCHDSFPDEPIFHSYLRLFHPGRAYSLDRDHRYRHLLRRNRNDNPLQDRGCR